MKRIKEIKQDDGMVNKVADWLYRLEDIQNAMGELGLADHNEKLIDVLIGFPNKEDKTVGELVCDKKMVINVVTENKHGKTLSDTTYKLDEKGIEEIDKKINCPRCSGNGYFKIKESVENPVDKVVQCPMCKSQGEINEETNNHRSSKT